ncbi:MAG: hypothetical protein WC978_00230 [bacterium]
MANLLELSRDIMARTDEGREALLAVKALRGWKSSAAVRRAHGSVSAYHAILVELHAAGKLKLKGESFMSSDSKKDGAELGLELHAKWVAAGRPGSFKAFTEREEKREAWAGNALLREQFPTFEQYEAHVSGTGGGR